MILPRFIIKFWRLRPSSKLDFRRRGFLLKEVIERETSIYFGSILALLVAISHHVSGAILFVWASVIDLYNRLKPGLTLAEINGEEEGGGDFTSIHA